MNKSSGGFAHRWLTVIAVLMAIAVNAFSNFFPPAGKNIGEVSNTTLAGVLITPAGYAFAIWGLIYIGLISYSIFQTLPRQQKPTVAYISWLLVSACLLQMSWVYVFLLSQFWISVAFIVGILVCLAFAYKRSRMVKPSRKNRWLLQAPLSLYFGWITVATVVNISSAIFVSSGQGALAQTSNLAVVCTVAMMAVSAGLAVAVALKFQDAIFPAVTVWALIAIAIRQADILPIAFSAVFLAVGVFIVLLRTVLFKSRRFFS